VSRWDGAGICCAGGNLRCEGCGGEHGVGLDGHCVGMLGLEVLLTVMFRNADAMLVGSFWIITTVVLTIWDLDG
jgi:hypothetical protein